MKDLRILPACLTARAARALLRLARHGGTALPGKLALKICPGLLAELGRGVDTVIYTDIARDGMLMGPNFSAYRDLSKVDGLQIIASGGVSTETDVHALAGLGLYGAIIGKAIYDGRIDLRRAIAAGKEAGV